jgi:hypothetical protein
VIAVDAAGPEELARVAALAVVPAEGDPDARVVEEPRRRRVAVEVDRQAVHLRQQRLDDRGQPALARREARERGEDVRHHPRAGPRRGGTVDEPHRAHRGGAARVGVEQRRAPRRAR